MTTGGRTKRKTPQVLRAPVSLSAFFMAAMVLVALLRPLPLQNAESRLYDMLIALRPVGPATSDVVVVAIDEASLARYGQWPWSRTQVAKLLRSIVHLEPAAVAVDIIFPETDRTADTPEDRATRRRLEDSGIFPLEGNETLNDRLLASVFAAGPFSLGYSFRFDGKGDTSPSNLHPFPFATLTPDAVSDIPLYTATGIIANRPLFTRSVRSSGFINATPDRDGIMRRIPVAISYKERIYPCLAVAALIQARTWPRVDLTAGMEGVQSLRCGTFAAPLDRQGNLLIDFRAASRPVQRIEAAHVIEERVPRDFIAGKVVIVGTTVPTIEKPVTTPFGVLLPGVELHALVVQNFLNGRAISLPPYEHLFYLVVTLLAGICGHAAFRRLRPLPGAAAMVVAAGATAGASILAMTTSGIFFSPLLPIVTVGGMYPIVMLGKYLRHEKKTAEQQPD